MFWNKEDSMVERAQKLAYKVHKGQTRWGDEPFIVHPKGVFEKLHDKNIANRLWTIGDNVYLEEVEKHDFYIVAWLHDVVEDTEYTLGNLLDLGFDYHIIQAVDAITRRDDEDYRSYILRVKKDEIAREVKIADIEHNLESFDHKRNKSRADKYKLALEILK